MTEFTSGPFSDSPRRGGVPPTAAIAVGSVAASEVEDEQRQARWAEWLAKGARQNLARRRRMQFVAYIVALGAAGWLWWRL